MKKSFLSFVGFALIVAITGSNNSAKTTPERVVMPKATIKTTDTLFDQVQQLDSVLTVLNHKIK